MDIGQNLGGGVPTLTGPHFLKIFDGETPTLGNTVSFFSFFYGQICKKGRANLMPPPLHRAT